MNEGNFILKAKSDYGRESILKHGKKYTYLKTVEHNGNGNFLVMIKSIQDETKLLVNLETDDDFKVKIFNEN